MRHMYQTLLYSFFAFWFIGVLIPLNHEDWVALRIRIPQWISRIFFIKKYKSVPIPAFIWQALTFLMLILNTIIIIFKPNVFSIVVEIFKFMIVFIPLPFFLYYIIVYDRKRNQIK